MNKIGSLGPVVFVVSPEATRTFDEFNRSSASRWAKSDIHLKKPRKQFLGPGLHTISFTMQFLASARINPRKEIEKLHELNDAGKALPLVIGGKPLGANLWSITSVDSTYDKIDGWGNVISGSASISLDEYVVKSK